MNTYYVLDMVQGPGDVPQGVGVRLASVCTGKEPIVLKDREGKRGRQELRLET